MSANTRITTAASKSATTHSKSTMILLGQAPDNYYLIPRPATLEGAIEEAKTLLDLPTKSTVIFQIQIDEILAVIIKTSWDELECLPLPEKIPKVQVKVIEGQEEQPQEAKEGKAGKRKG